MRFIIGSLSVFIIIFNFNFIAENILPAVNFRIELSRKPRMQDGMDLSSKVSTVSSFNVLKDGF